MNNVGFFEKIRLNIIYGSSISLDEQVFLNSKGITKKNQINTYLDLKERFGLNNIKIFEEHGFDITGDISSINDFINKNLLGQVKLEYCKGLSYLKNPELVQKICNLESISVSDISHDNIDFLASNSNFKVDEDAYIFLENRDKFSDINIVLSSYKKFKDGIGLDIDSYKFSNWLTSIGISVDYQKVFRNVDSDSLKQLMSLSNYIKSDELLVNYIEKLNNGDSFTYEGLCTDIINSLDEKEASLFYDSVAPSLNLRAEFDSLQRQNDRLILRNPSDFISDETIYKVLPKEIIEKYSIPMDKIREIMNVNYGIGILGDIKGTYDSIKKDSGIIRTLYGNEDEFYELIDNLKKAQSFDDLKTLFKLKVIFKYIKENGIKVNNWSLFGEVCRHINCNDLSLLDNYPNFESIKVEIGSMMDRGIDMSNEVIAGFFVAMNDRNPNEVINFFRNNSIDSLKIYSAITTKVSRELMESLETNFSDLNDFNSEVVKDIICDNNLTSIEQIKEMYKIRYDNIHNGDESIAKEFIKRGFSNEEFRRLQDSFMARSGQLDFSLPHIEQYGEKYSFETFKAWDMNILMCAINNNKFNLDSLCNLLESNDKKIIAIRDNITREMSYGYISREDDSVSVYGVNEDVFSAIKKELSNYDLPSINYGGDMIPSINKSDHVASTMFSEPYTVFKGTNYSADIIGLKEKKRRESIIVEESFGLYQSGPSAFIENKDTTYVVGRDWAIAYEENEEHKIIDIHNIARLNGNEQSSQIGSKEVSDKVRELCNVSGYTSYCCTMATSYYLFSKLAMEGQIYVEESDVGRAMGGGIQVFSDIKNKYRNPDGTINTNYAEGLLPIRDFRDNSSVDCGWTLKPLADLTDKEKKELPLQQSIFTNVVEKLKENYSIKKQQDKYYGTRISEADQTYLKGLLGVEDLKGYRDDYLQFMSAKYKPKDVMLK